MIKFNKHHVVNTETTEKIRQWIHEQHRGRSGMYPYRVAQDVALEFNISMTDARIHVLDYIRTESAKAINEEG